MKPWYEQLFDHLAGMLAKPAGVGPGSVSIVKPLGSGYDARAEEDKQRRAIVRFMEENVGDPYTYGAEIKPGEKNPKTGDCSEYTEHAHLNASLKYPDGVVNQKAFCNGRRVKNPKPGDPFFYSPNPVSGIPHTGIYVGNGFVVHAQGRPVSRVVRVPRADIEAHPRFEGWFRHPSLPWPVQERA